MMINTFAKVSERFGGKVEVWKNKLLKTSKRP